MLTSITSKVVTTAHLRRLSSSATHITKELVENKVRNIPVNSNASLAFARSQNEKIIKPFINTNPAASHTLDNYDQQNISRTNQYFCFTEHAATRFGSIDTLLKTAEIYSQNGYRWLGETPGLNGSKETHIYTLNVNGHEAVAVPLCFDPSLLSTKDYEQYLKEKPPVIESIFLSTLTQVPKTIRKALNYLPTPETYHDLFTPQELPQSVIDELTSYSHFTGSICTISKNFGIGAFNHLAERYQDRGGTFETMSIWDHADLLTKIPLFVKMQNPIPIGD